VAKFVTPTSAADLPAPTGIRLGTGLIVLTITGDRICAMTRFANRVLPWFRATAIAPEPIASFRAVDVRQPGSTG
jgi:hypothetical protein